MASQSNVLKHDLDSVEAELRVLADPRARVEAELLCITYEETLLRRQQRRLLHGMFAEKHGEGADASDDSVPAEVSAVTLGARCSVAQCAGCTTCRACPLSTRLWVYTCRACPLSTRLWIGTFVTIIEVHNPQAARQIGQPFELVVAAAGVPGLSGWWGRNMRCRPPHLE